MYYVLHTHRSSSGNFHLTFVLQGFVSSARCHIFPFVNSHFFSLSLVSCSGECKWFNHWFLHSVTFQLHSFFSSSFFIFLSLSLSRYFLYIYCDVEVWTNAGNLSHFVSGHCVCGLWSSWALFLQLWSLLCSLFHRWHGEGTVWCLCHASWI